MSNKKIIAELCSRNKNSFTVIRYKGNKLKCISASSNFRLIEISLKEANNEFLRRFDYCSECNGRGVVFPKGYKDLEPNIVELSLISESVPMLKCRCCDNK